MLLLSAERREAKATYDEYAGNGVSMKKEQHYLPRFYLRQFAVDAKRRNVSLFNVNRMLLVEEASIKHQASEPFMYGEDGEMEEALMLLETETARVLRRMIQYGRAPRQYSLDHQALAAFVVAQRRRTPRAARELIESVNLPLAIAFRDDSRYAGVGREVLIAPENPPAAAVGWSLWLWPLLLDLRCKLLWTSLVPGFITSDNPAVYYNQLLESRRRHFSNTGLQTRGLQVFLPVSPQAVLMLYDGNAYRAGSCFRNAVHVARRQDVVELNKLQAPAADVNLYFSTGIVASHLHALLDQARSAREAYHVQAREYRNPNNSTEGLIHVRAPEIRLKLELSFVRPRPGADRDVDYTSVIAPRDRRTWDLTREFAERTLDGRASQEDLFYFLAANGKMRRTRSSYLGHRDAARGRPSAAKGGSSDWHRETD